MRCREQNSWYRGLAPIIASIALVGGAACRAETEPSTTPLDVRTAPGDTAVLYGWVYHPAPPSTPWKERRPVPAAVVELGTWRGTPYEFRDSLVRAVGARPDDPRFHVIARARTDAAGRFRFGGVPKPQIFAMRARPPAGLPYRVTYFESLFGLAHVDSVNFSITFVSR
jgi:hypothetical protein